MNIAIDAILFHEYPRGVGRYLNDLFNTLSEIDSKNDYFIYYGNWMKRYDFTKIKKPNIHLVELNLPKNKIIRNLYQIFILPWLMLKNKPDVIHKPDTTPVIFFGSKTVCTIHDIAEYVYPEKYSKIQALARKMIVRIETYLCKKIITISEYSKKSMQEILNIDSNKIKVIPLGISVEKFNCSGNKEILKKLNIEEKGYLFFVGEIERTKNVIKILEAFNVIKNQSNLKVVICGKEGNDFYNVKKYIVDNSLNEYVIFAGYITDEELISLYSNCFLFVFPSLFEGFGFPVLEAMACGAPVACSNVTSIPEVGGDAVLKFNPNNIDEIVETIRIMEDNDVRIRYIENGYKNCKKYLWRNTATETIKVYESIK